VSREWLTEVNAAVSECVGRAATIDRHDKGAAGKLVFEDSHEVRVRGRSEMSVVAVVVAVVVVGTL